MFGAMAAMFVVALSVPEAFDDLDGGWSGPVVIALGYLAVRLLHLTIRGRGGGQRRPGPPRQLIRWAPSVVGGTAFLLVASQLHGRAQTLAWAAALVADYLGTILAGASGWRLNSAAHFAERHGLIVIIALGESIVAIGLGVVRCRSRRTDRRRVGARTHAGRRDLVGVLRCRVADRRAHAPAPARGGEARLARDAYSYLHLPMIAGIVLMALGLEEVVPVGGETDPRSATRWRPAARRVVFGRRLVLARARGVHVPVERLVKVRRVIAPPGLLVLIPVGLNCPGARGLACSWR